jgi:hypothetical protein
MPTPTYTPLATVTLGSSAASVTFSNIPATYRDLILVIESKASTSGVEGQLRFNGDSSNSYSFVRMRGNGSTTASTTGTLTHMPLVDTVKATTTRAPIYIVQIMDYSATDKHKPVLVRSGEADTGVEAFANRWANTGAINSILVKTNTGSWAAAGRFDLYGVIA